MTRTYEEEVARSKKMKLEEGWYWVIKTWGENREPEIVYFERDSEGGRFRSRTGSWGTDYSYKVLEGPLAYQPKG